MAAALQSSATLPTGDPIPLVRLVGIGKSFPGTHALKSIDLDVFSGEVLGVVGENGAGKSTLIKILTGAYVPSCGSVMIDGKKVDLRTPADAQALGLNAVHQEVVLCAHLSVAENIFLGLEPNRIGMVQRRLMNRQAQAVLDRLGFEINAGRQLGQLTIGQQQLVATARATVRDCRLLIFDEPTAYLTRQESNQLFQLIGRLRAQGVAVIYISHRMEEVFELCQRAVVLRDGELVATRMVSETNERQLIRDMANREIGDVHYKQRISIGKEVLAVDGLSGPGFEDVSLTLRRGEIVGLFGLVGAGRSELAQSLFGRQRLTAGTITIEGAPFVPLSERISIRKGLALVPESRRIQGLCLNQSVAFNLNLAAYERISRGGLVSRNRERAVAAEQIGSLKIATAGQGTEVANLSGGNQQKVVIGKWINRGADIFIFDEPTAGVDVGTKREIYGLFAELLKKGAAILLISSYLPEVYDLSDRLVVMYRGRVARTFENPRSVSQDDVLAAAIGD
ncbi:sugar ABC transporter ATP-binding protein [Mesorhizobium sp. M0862]|uniref:sugar ABC transporter ATP-binding protein n=1 Tax=Mesorhizobium sp. M0862 TaxID=2957015 RepID=UPI00333C435D